MPIAGRRRHPARHLLTETGVSHAVGSRFTTIRRFAGAEQRLVQEVSEVSPPHRWTAKAISGLHQAGRHAGG
jgi:hypothetical protein